jgi:hypothetical protein
LTDIGNNGIYTDNANWAQDLAYSWNASLYDFAYGGATCDNHIEQYVDAVSVSQQVADYISRNEGKNMNASESIYAIFIGINDANLFNGKLGPLLIFQYPLSFPLASKTKLVQISSF